MTGRHLTVKLHGGGEAESIDLAYTGGPEGKLQLDIWARGGRQDGVPAIQILATGQDVSNVLKAIKSVMP